MKKIVTRLFCRSGLDSVVARNFRWSGVLVLNYHRIGNGDASPFDRGLWSADAETFANQMRFCRSRLDVITPDDLESVVARRRGRYALVTFDDGYRDNYETAFPILKSEGVPATFFVATGFMDSPRVPWWDDIAWMVRTSRRDPITLPKWLPAPVSLDEPERESAVRKLLRTYKALRVEFGGRYLDAVAEATGSGRCPAKMGGDLWMDWRMLREMKSAGMTVAGHTVNHHVLARAAREKQRAEILGCAGRLAEEMKAPMQYFSYPVGGPGSFDSVTVNCLKEAGVRYAFSYYGGLRRFDDWNDYDIPRVPIETYLTADWFRSIISLPQVFA